MRTERQAVLRWLVALALSVGSAGGSSVAYAQEPSDVETRAEASRLYNEASRALTEERYREAAVNFEAASRLKPHAVALYTAAQAWELAGEPARAADAFALALATPQLDEAQAARARERLDALERSLAVVSVLGDETTRVQLDDHSEFRAPARLHASGGTHVLLILRGDGSVERRKIQAVKGEVLELDAEDREAEPAPPPPKPKPLAEPQLRPVVEPERDSVWKTVGFVTAGAGLASVLGGVLLGLSANDAEKAYSAGPTRESLDHARSLETKTNLMLVVGGVLTAAGVTLIVWQPDAGDTPQRDARLAPRAKLGVSLGQVWAAGSF